MNKFEKIKTVAEKRQALDKRGKAVKNDFTPGDILFITEKVDGHNASFDDNGVAYSREHVIEPKNNAPLVPFANLIQAIHPHINDVITETLDPEHTYQFYGEFMVYNRVIQYKEDIYGTWFMFDIFDNTTKSYLGTQKAIEVAAVLKSMVPSNVSDKIMTPTVLHDSFVFETYEGLEAFVYSKHQDSLVAIDGIMEGGVASNLSASFQNKQLRAKIVNSKFKETQRQVTNHKNHSVEIRNLLQYLTQARVSKIIMNLRDEGILQPTSPAYFTSQLELAVRTIAKDINDESDLELPYQTMVAGEKVYNKIEAMARLTMVDIKNKH